MPEKPDFKGFSERAVYVTLKMKNPVFTVQSSKDAVNTGFSDIVR